MSPWYDKGIIHTIKPMVLALICLMMASSATAGKSQAELKTAYTLNFARFTHWPTAAPTTEPLQFCMVGNSATISALMNLKAEIYRRPIATRHLRLPANIEGCDLLYLTAIATYRLPRILAALKGKALLTISDIPGFARAGGMIELINQGSRIRFKINQNATDQAGLRLDAKLLKLATQVYPKLAEPSVP